MRVSKNLFGTKQKPRISIFCSNRYTYAQAINDEVRTTIIAFSSLQLEKKKGYQKNKKSDEAKMIGLALVEELKRLNIKKAVFDRGLYKYGGRVKALAEGLREGGIKI